MKTLTVILMLALTSYRPAIAEGGCWDDCGPPPEPPVTVQPSVRTSSDRDALPQSHRLPCCVRAGELVPLWEMFATPEGTKRRCEKAIDDGRAVILECPGVVSPEASK